MRSGKNFVKAWIHIVIKVRDVTVDDSCILYFMESMSMLWDVSNFIFGKHSCDDKSRLTHTHMWGVKNL